MQDAVRLCCWGGDMCDTLRGKTNPHCRTRDASVMLQCRSVSLCSRLSEPAPQTLRSALCSGTQPPGDNTSLQLHSVTSGCSKEKGREAPEFLAAPVLTLLHADRDGCPSKQIKAVQTNSVTSGGSSRIHSPLRRMTTHTYTSTHMYTTSPAAEVQQTDEANVQR